MNIELLLQHLRTDLDLSIPVRLENNPTFNSAWRDLVALTPHRYKNEGIPHLHELLDSYKKELASLCASGALSERFGHLPAEGNSAAITAVLGYMSWSAKLAPVKGAGYADYPGFLARNREAANLGSNLRAFLPLSSTDRKTLSVLFTPSQQCYGKHGPGATAEKLRGWDKWLALEQPTRPIIRMTDVPKDSRKRRLIGIEHAAMQFVQQGLAAELRSTPWFRRWVTLEDQKAHVAFACDNRRGATPSGDALFHCTIDLEDASDRVTPAMVEYLLPEWYQNLAVASSRYAEIDGELHPLGMMATMGNGFCFELETAIFHIVTSLAGRYATGGALSLAEAARQCRVYGDDIIAPEAWFPALEVIFLCLGWVINRRKTALTPHFLETCGHYIFTDATRKRFCPSLTYSSQFWGHVLEWESTQHRLDTANAALASGFNTVARAIAQPVLDEARYRWNYSLHRHEIKLSTLREVTRPLNVTETTRLLAYWVCGTVSTSKQRVEGTGVKRRSLSWIPLQEYSDLAKMCCS